MASISFDDLDLGEFEEDDNNTNQIKQAANSPIDRKRPSLPNTNTNTSLPNIQTTPITKEQEVFHEEKRLKESTHNKTNAPSDTVLSRWQQVFSKTSTQTQGIFSVSLLSVDFSSIDYIRKNHLKITNTIIVEIISIKKTETGYYCQFQDNSGSIFGTLNNEVIKKYQPHIDVGSIIIAHKVPILYVVQSGNCYLIITENNVDSILNKYEQI